jgi:IrrE N-terminal-like domain
MGERFRQVTYNPIRALQAFVPRTGLDHTEALIVAEVQATILLKMVGVIQPPVPVLILAQYLDVVYEHDALAGEVGYHVLRGDTWHIGYCDPNPSERNVTVAHQLKLVLDAPFDLDELYPPVAVMAPLLRKHHVAEYFAQCLTMPGAWMQQAWRRGDRDVERLAELYGVSAAQMLFRLKTLRLVELGL